MRLARGAQAAAGAVALSMLVACTDAKPARPAKNEPKIAGAGAKDLRAAIDRAASEHAIPGASVAIAVDGTVVWSGATGKADVETGRRVTTETRFPIASVTKTFTSALIMRLAQDGVLSLDAPIKRWLPAFPNAGRITLRHVLSHTSGIDRSEQDRGPWQPWTAERLASLLDAPVCAPGACMRYADENFILAGLVVAAATRKPVDATMRERILNPLGLGDTDLEGALVADVAQWYDEDKTAVPERHLDDTWTAGAMYSTASDLVRFVSALFGGRVLAAPSLAQMTDVRATRGKRCVGDDCPKGYGLGIEQSAIRGRVAWGHEGSSGALMRYLPEKKMAIAVVQNIVPQPPAIPEAILDAVLDKLSGFENRSDLYVVNADGSNPRRLTSAPGVDGTPMAWSPDRRTIVFHSDRDGNIEVYTMNADGTGQQRLTRNDGVDAGASWTPDGRIVFGSDRGGTRGLYVMNADGSNVRPLPGMQPGDWFPSVSPDGSRVAFTRGGEGEEDLWVMNFDGTGRRALAAEPGSQGWAAWSPDGRTIAYESAVTVRLVNPDGTGKRLLEMRGRPGREPSWSPDGGWIAFMRYRDLFVIRPDGTGERRIVDHAADEFGPAWSPDGKRIVFTSNRS